MIYDIAIVIWNDAFAFEEEELNKETFQLSPTVQCGLIINEDQEKIRIVHGYCLDHDEHDFIIIPKSCITKLVKLGSFDTETKKIIKS